MMEKTTTGILLFSGGLDSILACKLLQDHSVTLRSVHFSTPFTKDLDWPRKTDALLGLSTTFLALGDAYLDILRSPAYGYGANLNPCIDCRIMMLQRAKELFDEMEASFIVTGEVVGERPMTQSKNTMRMIEKRSGLDGLIVRPLSARLLPPSIPEQTGVVDRERLLNLSGRGRKRQLELAKNYGITEVPTPAGGCLLTDPSFSTRVKDLMDHGELTRENVQLLLHGRHFRLVTGGKAVVARNEGENARLLQSSGPHDLILEIRGGRGPVVLLRADNLDGLAAAASLCAKYARSQTPAEILYRRRSGDLSASMVVAPASVEFCRQHLV
jgi:tRNA U34 2-thiouridine synthase MnmA/TrmU